MYFFFHPVNRRVLIHLEILSMKIFGLFDLKFSTEIYLITSLKKEVWFKILISFSLKNALPSVLSCSKKLFIGTIELSFIIVFFRIWNYFFLFIFWSFFLWVISTRFTYWSISWFCWLINMKFSYWFFHFTFSTDRHFSLFF